MIQGVGDSRDPAIETDSITRPPWLPVCVQRNLATSSNDCTGRHEPNLGLPPFPSCTQRAAPHELPQTSCTTMDGLNVVRMVSPQ